MQKTLFLLDGHALVYRAHYAFISRPLINSKGFDTSAINGFTRTLWEIIQNQKPTHIAVSFDLPGGTFRNEMYSEYKANRDAQPEQITAALPYIFKIIEGMNIPILVKQGFEADDVIGTIAKKAEQADFKVFMMTPDKDYGQLVTDKVFMYKPARMGNDMEIWGVKEVCENWNIKNTLQVIDILGLQGDAVDNIPGVPGIGPKTAAILLEKYGSIEGVLANTHELKGKQKENLEQFAAQAILSKELATIDINVPIEFDEEALKLTPVNVEMLSEVFKELEFRSIATQILGTTQSSSSPTMPNAKSGARAAAPISNTPNQMDLFGNPVALPAELKSTAEASTHHIADKNISNVEHAYYLIETAGQRAALAQKISEQKEVSFDTETTSIDATQADLVGLSFSFSEHEGYYIPVPENREEAIKVVNDFKYILENQTIIKIGQNIKYDMIVLKSYGVEVQGIFFDTMLAHYLIEPELRHNMNYMSETLLNYAPVSIETLIGTKGKSQGTMRDVPIEKVKDYAAEDADVTLQLKNVLAEKLRENPTLEKIFYDFETPLVKVLAEMESEGIRIDSAFLDAYSVELQAKIEILEKNIIELAGINFNVASPKQVGGILFDVLKLDPKAKKTKSGQYSTDEDVMSELAKQFPIAALILEHRGLSKLKSTYVDALPKMVNPRTGRVHSNFNQALTATGRLSSNNPNLQNIPIKTPEGSEVRKAFVPRDENHVLVSADYSQIELRLIAEISGDEAMLEAFLSGNDFHRATAAKVYGVDYEAVTAEQRRNAKTVNFSITYGAGASNLSQQLGIPRSEAKILVDNYRLQFSGLRDYMTKIVEKAREQGFVTTMLGRRRFLRDIDSRNALARSNSERMAVNTPIQGTAADMIKIAMINIHKALKDNNLQTKMILQVHDELVFDVPKNELEQVKILIENGMKNAIPGLKVPIEVGIGQGLNWLEAH
jgi:DNA polymerase I